MFQLSSTAKDGCPASRCKGVSLEHPENPHKLCGRHFGDWLTAGKPELATAEPKPRAKRESANGRGVALAEVPAEIVTEIELQRNTARAALDMCRHFRIESQIQMDATGPILAECKRQRKRLEEIKEFLLAPHKEGTKRVKQLVDPPIEFYDSCERALKAQISSFLKAQQEAQDRALAAVAESVAATPGTVSAPVETLAVASGVENVTAAAGLGQRRVWRVVSVDREKLLKHRPDLMIPDMKRIEALVREHGADNDIPGVRVEPDIVIINNT